jgi:peptide-methionine (S)-S-oxide reductase
MFAPKSAFRLHPRAWLSSQGISAVALIAVMMALAAVSARSFAAEEARQIPAPTADEQAAMGQSETAVFAGGCFWGVQGVFQHVKGVANAVSGYAGGEASTAQYETVSTGETGHAESVRVTFDPHQVSYGKLLHIYFSVVHNPTELNRQGPDEGTQYRSEVFAETPDQARIAKAYIAELSKARAFDAAIVTKVEPLKGFYPAEGYHQDYLTLHPNQPYIAINDLPKVAALKKLFPDQYRADPVLVGSR